MYVFSSRNRHTRYWRDWSSDVCSSDLVSEAPKAIGQLLELGARLDLDADGRPALTREGGHSRDRIVHAGGEPSGAEVTRTLPAAPRQRGCGGGGAPRGLERAATPGGRGVVPPVAR